MSSPSRFQTSAGILATLFPHKRKSSQHFQSDRERISLGHQPAQGENDTLPRPSGSESDQLLGEGKSEILQQECRAEFGDRTSRELQRQIESNRIEIYHTNYGYETSRREQARLHEELAREAHIRSIHEMQEMKRVHEMRNGTN